MFFFVYKLSLLLNLSLTVLCSIHSWLPPHQLSIRQFSLLKMSFSRVSLAPCIPFDPQPHPPEPLSGEKNACKSMEVPALEQCNLCGLVPLNWNVINVK